MPERAYQGLEVTGISKRKNDIMIHWSCPSLGFGTVRFYTDDDTGELRIDSEYMTMEFVLALLDVALPDIDLPKELRG